MALKYSVTGYKQKTEIFLVIRGGSRTAATSQMECFVTIVNGWLSDHQLAENLILVFGLYVRKKRG